MKKLIIIGGIVLGACLITLVCVFGIPALIEHNKNLNSNIASGSEKTSDEEDDTGEEVTDEINFILADDLELLVGQEVDLFNFFVSTNFNAYDILITSESNLLVVSGLKVKVTDNCNIEIFVLSKLKTESDFKELGSFNIIAYQKFNSYLFDFETEFKSINECTLNITFNKGIDLDCINLDFNALHLISRVDNTNGKEIELTIEIGDKFSGYLNFSYSKTVYKGEKDEFSKQIELMQNCSYFKLYNQTTDADIVNKENINLYLTKDYCNYGSVYAFNDIIVKNGLKINNPIYTFVCSNDCIEITENDNYYKIKAKEVGQTDVMVKYFDFELFNFKVIVGNIEVEEVALQRYIYDTFVGEEIDISSLDVSPTYAPYEVRYVCLNKNAIVSEKGEFSAKVAGEYEVIVYVNDIPSTIKINVKEKDKKSYIIVYDEDGKEIDSIELNGEKSISVTFSLDGEKILGEKIKGLIAVINGNVDNNVIPNDEKIDVDFTILTFNYDVGEYVLVLKIDGTEFETKPIKVKIN